MWERLGRLVMDSFTAPRETAHAVLALGLKQDALVIAAGAVSALTAIFYALFFATLGAMPDLDMPPAPSPIGSALQNLLSIGILSWLLYAVGRGFGGRGAFVDSLCVVVWLNFVQLVVLAATVVTLLILPPVAAIIALVLGIWTLWIMASFVAALHGFQNTFLVLGGILAAVIGLALVMSIVFAAILGTA